jgi:hypothetical protein
VAKPDVILVQMAPEILLQDFQMAPMAKKKNDWEFSRKLYIN